MSKTSSTAELLGLCGYDLTYNAKKSWKYRETMVKMAVLMGKYGG